VAVVVTATGALGAGMLAAPRAARAVTAASRIVVVAAENFYGDIVGQIGGDHVAVTSIITDPNVDPHEYETSAKDAAAVANASLVIQNGLGYDAFMDKLLAASPNPKRKVLVVANVTGHKKGDNQHIWYDPPTLPKVAQAILDALVQVDPANATSYRNWHRAFQASLAPFNRAVAALKAQAAGTPIAVTEPIFAPMAASTGLKIITPLEFQKAIEEGEDPPAAALARMEDQLKKHKAKVLIYNGQTVSPITTRVLNLARQVGVPVVVVTETLPPGKSFQQWMVSQVEAVLAALGPGK
jgi:zinc/manganese transport system substrate-binding protein